MVKNVKKKVMLAVLVVLALGNTLSVAAATSANSASYSGYVKKTEDYVTDSLYKTTVNSGTNKVSSITAGASLCSWINNYIGMQVTDKANFSGAGTYSMPFNVTADVENPGGHLSTTMVISTRWYEFDSANAAGEWSPDPF